MLLLDKNGEKKGHDMAAMTWSKLVHAQVHIGIYMFFFEFNHDIDCIDYAVHAMTWSVSNIGIGSIPKVAQPPVFS